MQIIHHVELKKIKNKKQIYKQFYLFIFFERIDIKELIISINRI